MSFNIGLSGLYAANKQLDVTGNNIANVATTGFKSSRAEFEDVYSATKLGTGSKTIGNGVRLANVSQQFTQGDINNTGNVLDMGINGSGFFVLSNNGSLSYTRAGTFKVDKDGYVTNTDGTSRLQGYGVDANGKIINGVLTDLRIDTSNLAPKSTTTVSSTINLNSTAAVIDQTVADQQVRSDQVSDLHQAVQHPDLRHSGQPAHHGSVHGEDWCQHLEDLHPDRWSQPGWQRP